MTQMKLNLVGEDKSIAINLLKAAGSPYRILREDNNAYMVTCDYRLDRYNLTIDNGKVSQVTMG